MATRTVGRIQTRAAFGQLQRSRARASCGPVRAIFVPADTGASGVYPQVGYAMGNTVAMLSCATRFDDVCGSPPGASPRRFPEAPTCSGSSPPPPVVSRRSS